MHQTHWKTHSVDYLQRYWKKQIHFTRPQYLNMLDSGKEYTELVSNCPYIVLHSAGQLCPYSRRQIPFTQNSMWSTNVCIRWSNNCGKATFCRTVKSFFQSMLQAGLVQNNYNNMVQQTKTVWLFTVILTI